MGGLCRVSSPLGFPTTLLLPSKRALCLRPQAMTELSVPVSCALVLRKLRERAAEARGQVNEASVLKEEQAGDLAAPSPTPALP